MSDKIGERAIERFLRQGAKEIAQVIPATKESIQVVEEPAILPREKQPMEMDK